MATSASQTYIARLGFQDRDRSNSRHGLACEYLFERLLELEVAPAVFGGKRNRLRQSIDWTESEIVRLHGYESSHVQDLTTKLDSLHKAFYACGPDETLAAVQHEHKPGECLNVPITSRSYVNGFADVLIRHYRQDEACGCWLGEVKITQEPAENVLQQVNFYVNYLERFTGAYILTDYDPAELKRLCAGTKIKVYRLGQRFEDWLATRTVPVTEEL